MQLSCRSLKSKYFPTGLLVDRLLASQEEKKKRERESSKVKELQLRLTTLRKPGKEGAKRESEKEKEGRGNEFTSANSAASPSES